MARTGKCQVFVAKLVPYLTTVVHVFMFFVIAYSWVTLASLNANCVRAFVISHPFTRLTCAFSHFSRRVTGLYM